MKKQPEHNRKNVPPQDTAKAPKSAVSRSMRTRAIVLAALFVLVGFGAVVYNLYQLQIVQHDELAARAENQRYASVVYAHDKLCDLLLFSRGEGKSLACVAEESNAADPGIEEKVYFTLQAAAVDGVVLAKRGREDRAYAGQPLIYILHFFAFHLFSDE